MREQAREVRTVVVDRALHLRMRADMTLDVVRRSRGLLALVASVALLGIVLGRPVTGVVGAGAGVVAWVVVWWLRLGRTMRHGLGVGQAITVRHADDGEPALAVADVTGEVVLGRGSALVVTRFRSCVSVFGRQLSFVLPVGLLTDAEIAFLEGHGTTPDGAEDVATGSSSALPLSLRVTEDVQRRTVAALVRAIALSADALLPVVVALAFLVLGVALRSAPWSVVGAVLAAVALVTTPRAVGRARAMVRMTYPVGRTVHAAVTPDALTTELDAVVLAVTWQMYDARRVTADAVLLRRKGPFLSPDVFSVHPRDLFDDASISTLAAALPRTF